MKTRRSKSEYKAAPPITGLMNCLKGHQWDVTDLNPERVAVNCPICGTLTNILQGLQNGK